MNVVELPTNWHPCKHVAGLMALAKRGQLD